MTSFLERKRIGVIFKSRRSVKTPQESGGTEPRTALTNLLDIIDPRWRPDLQRATGILNAANQLLNIEDQERPNPLEKDMLKLQIASELFLKRFEQKNPHQLVELRPRMEQTLREMILEAVAKANKIPIHDGNGNSLPLQEIKGYVDSCKTAAQKIVELCTDEKGRTLPRPNEFNVRSQLPALFHQIRLSREEIAPQPAAISSE